MAERGHGRVLVVCAALALLVHAGVLARPAWLAFGAASAAEKQAREPSVDQPLPEREIELGRADARTPSVAWISYEDYRELVAPEARTEQPAVQQEVEPVVEALDELEPVPPAPTPAEEAMVQAEAPVMMPRAAEPPPLPEFEAAGELPRPTPEAVPTDEPMAPAAAAATTASPEQPPAAAPRSESEADATQIDPRELEYRPGGVIVGPGIEVQTAKPTVRPSMMTALPNNPTVRVYFNAEGKVDKAEIVQSTEQPDWDGTVLTSLYRWRAKGEQIEAADRHVVVEIKYFLHDYSD